ncbi:MAG: GDSL-type esterase/lipase family protein [Bacteroidales bacterium]
MRIKPDIYGLLKILPALILFLPGIAYAQLNPFEIDKFDFIDYDENHFIMNEHQNSDIFFNKLDSLILRGKGKLNVLHIGDSHIQADYISGQLRRRFQKMAWGLNGGRGFIFPVKMAQSNNPWNYTVSYTGNWTACKNVQEKRDCPLGLAGYLVSTKSKETSIQISFKEDNYLTYTYNRLRVYHNMDTANWEIMPADTNLNYKIRHAPDSGFSVIQFDKTLHDISLKINRKTEKGEFVLRGFEPVNTDPGIVYHAVGVNGAETESWLRCPLLENEIAGLNPDFIIISLGTNDAYTNKFDIEAFENNARTLLYRIRQAAPSAAILWTTPGDNYRYRKYLNYNTKKAAKVIKKLGEEAHFMVWDFYNIMGELNAIMSWNHAGLTARDKLHFNKKGYLLQGNLLFNAFLRAYNQHIEQKTKN